jgi:hypothetical protein
MNSWFENRGEKEVDAKAFRQAYEAKYEEPSLEVLLARFDAAFKATRDPHSAMAAVNEVLETPITYEELVVRARRAA